MAFLKGIRRLKSCTLRPKKMAAVCHQKAAASPERKPKEGLPSSSKIVHGGLLGKNKTKKQAARLRLCKAPSIEGNPWHTKDVLRSPAPRLQASSIPWRSRITLDSKPAVVLYITIVKILIHIDQQITRAQDVSLRLLRPALARQAQHLLPIELLGHRNLHLHLHRLQHAKRLACLQDVARLHSV